MSYIVVTSIQQRPKLTRRGCTFLTLTRLRKPEKEYQRSADDFEVGNTDSGFILSFLFHKKSGKQGYGLFVCESRLDSCLL